MKLNIGFLCSHNGSNMQAIIDNVNSGYLDANLCAMISNNFDAYSLKRAEEASIPNFVINSKSYQHPDNEIIRLFKLHNVNIVVLAGYMKLVSAELINAFDGKILNIHPALLPKFGGNGMYGLNIHKAVLEAGETKTGATVHIVSPIYDSGRILSQMEVPVMLNDTPDILSERVLEVEHIIYSATLKNIEIGEIML